MYVPVRAPLTDEAKQTDPFALYAVCGSLFPEGDGDEYMSLCLKAKPDHATEIRQVFAQEPNPSFAVIDAVGEGLDWPNLRALLGMESARDILGVLLAPNEAQLKALKGQLSDHARDQEGLIDFYLGSLREVDRLQREFEQAVGDFLEAHDFMAEVVEQVRARYRRLAETVQVLFTKHLDASGWPPAGRLANADVFDRLVAPKLQESGRRIAYFLVDALRYELGVALEQQLADDCPIELQAAFAQLPSITSVGMASLLPEAGQQLCLRKHNDTLVPMFEETPVTTVNQRMDMLRKRYGQRFTDMLLPDLIRGKQQIPDTVELLVVRSGEIDSQLESNPETTLGLIHDTLKRIRFALHKPKQQGFHDVVISPITVSSSIPRLKPAMCASSRRGTG